MKVIAVNGSPKADGNTFHALNMVGSELKENGIGFEILHIGNKQIHGCLGCNKCGLNKDEKCSIKTDDLNEYIQKLKEADGIILGSPVYYSGIAGTMKCFLDRVFYVSGSNGNLFRHKVGAAVCAVRRSGGSSTLDGLYHYLTYSEMILATANYWSIIHGRAEGEALSDTEGSQIMRILGKNMAWILKMKEVSECAVTPPEKEKKVSMNFIR
ncbi:MAG: flavodoxin family protein [Ignavibacteria bacterium]|jgi:multimeric flavodoxin WrbA|nr:flavodoxin family protein [Ignavibacteria bacterium]MCU7502075.1 flavodoxin family protein [Ignavibacteria bacterium]MCU7515477.1 flavodoxin family protein [Ignavibacteria bacterium]